MIALPLPLPLRDPSLRWPTQLPRDALEFVRCVAASDAGHQRAVAGPGAKVEQGLA